MFGWFGGTRNTGTPPFRETSHLVLHQLLLVGCRLHHLPILLFIPRNPKKNSLLVGYILYIYIYQLHPNVSALSSYYDSLKKIPMKIRFSSQVTLEVHIEAVTHQALYQDDANGIQDSNGDDDVDHNLSGHCKGISPENMAKNMVLTYLHFRILKFPLTTSVSPV